MHTSAPAQDLPRTFPNNVWLCTPEARHLLHRVLLAYSMHNPQVSDQVAAADTTASETVLLGWRHPWQSPFMRCRGLRDAQHRSETRLWSPRAPQVGYCQGLNFLAGMLLLVLRKNEERAFWILVSLLDEGGWLRLHMESSSPPSLCCRAPAAACEWRCCFHSVGCPQPWTRTNCGPRGTGAHPWLRCNCRHPVREHVLAQPARRARGDAIPGGALHGPNLRNDSFLTTLLANAAYIVGTAAFLTYAL